MRYLLGLVALGALMLNGCAGGGAGQTLPTSQSPQNSSSQSVAAPQSGFTQMSSCYSSNPDYNTASTTLLPETLSQVESGQVQCGIPTYSFVSYSNGEPAFLGMATSVSFSGSGFSTNVSSCHGATLRYDASTNDVMLFICT